MLLPELWHLRSTSTGLVRLTSCRNWQYNSSALDARSTGIVIHPRFALRKRSIRLLEKRPSHLDMHRLLVGDVLCECCPV